MNYKKIQTTVKTNGDASNLEIGWVSNEQLDRDIERERERFARVATAGARARPAVDLLQAVEVAGNTITAIYGSGTVRIVNYVPEEEES